MILVNPNPRDDLTAYGIEIPLLPSRAVNIERYIRSTFSRNQTHIFSEWKPGYLEKKDLLLAHSADYVARLGDPEQCQEEVISCYELIDRSGKWRRYNPKQARLSLLELIDAQYQEAYGTLQASQIALDTGFCYFLGGGMHHAMSFTGRGFCLVNDLVISIRNLQEKQLIKQAWIIDVDAHKGDGTAEITQNDESILTLSIHMVDSWPLIDLEVTDEKQADAVQIPSDVEIAHSQGEESQYLGKLEEGLDLLQQKSPRSPDLVIVVNGSDPYELDVLPSTATLRLTKSQLLQRDQMIFSHTKARGIPSTWVMAGGYGEKSWEIHAQFIEWALGQ